jgi:site-specific recombinase XerD
VLDYLESEGVVEVPAEQAAGTAFLDDQVERYCAYLTYERGLMARTVKQYQRTARRFLCHSVQPESSTLEQVSASDVTRFVLHDASPSSVGCVKYKVSSLRSFLRFLYVDGQLPTDLAGAVPAVSGWRLAGLPQDVPPEQMQKVFRSCDRRTLVGRRDFAVLKLLGRLGLRSGEVAVLQLDDVEWPRGELIVRGKGNREARLPLPVDVGEALVGYLRWRPSQQRFGNLFLQMMAPYGGLSSSAVSRIVYRAFRRAGLAPTRAHRLRHTAATQMLRAGASLSDIGQVLRHRSVDTTAIYAKVDRDALRPLAQPWPGGAA